MFKKIKKGIKCLTQSIGFDVYLHPISSQFNDSYQLYQALKHFGVDLVFDIGASAGEFASELRSIGYEGSIVSFEPLTDAHKQLTMESSQDPHWYVHSPTAIGDFDGEVEINISTNSQSSSILPMLDSHLSSAPQSKYIGKENVAISQLDSISTLYLRNKEKYFLKIDTQGFEWQVFDGAKKTLSQAQGVLCELSLVPLYEGQRLWLEIIDRLSKEGLTLWAIQKGFIDKRDGRALQVNAIFFRLS